MAFDPEYIYRSYMTENLSWQDVLAEKIRHKLRPVPISEPAVEIPKTKVRGNL